MSTAVAPQMSASIQKIQRMWAQACGEGDLYAMARNADRLETLRRVRRATRSARRMVAAVKVLAK